MHEHETTVEPEALRRWIADMAKTRGVSEEDALLLGEALVDADLRGVTTHGVAQMPVYLDLFDRGVLNPAPEVSIQEHGAVLKVNADCGIGHVVGVRVLEVALEIAAHEGVAIATMAEIGHLGALGYFTRKAAEAGMTALLMQNGPPLMGLTGSGNRAIGNNPLSFAAPVPGRPPVVFDVATSEAAYGKLNQAIAAGRPIPENWALDSDGVPTTDPRAAAAGILLPSGGFKGIGLAMMVDVFAGGLTGTRPVWGRNIFGAFLMVVDPTAAAGRDVFAADIASWIGTYEASSDQARYPGARAAESFEQKSAGGIALVGSIAVTLAAIGRSAGIPFPASIS